MKAFITALLGTTILCALSFAQAPPLPTGTGGEVLQINPTIINPTIIGGVASGALGGIAPQVTTNAGLLGACTGFATNSCPAGRAVYSSGVWRVGLNSAGDVTPLFWKPQNSACSPVLGDIGSCNPAADGTSFVAVYPLNIIDVTQFGASITSSDNTSAVNAAMAAAAKITAGATLTFPTGTFVFTGRPSLTFPNSSFCLSINGQGLISTKLKFTGVSGGFNFTGNNINNCVNFEELSITTTQAGGGTAVNLNQTASIALPGNVPPSTFRNVAILGDDGPSGSDYWTTGINVSSWSNVYTDNSFLWSGGNALNTGTGIALAGNVSNFGVIYNIGGSFVGGDTGLNIGTYIQGVTVTVGSNFTNIFRNGVICNSSTGTAEINIIGAQFATASADIVNNQCFGFVAVGNYLLGTAANTTGISLVNTYGEIIANNTFEFNSFANFTGVLISGETVPAHVVNNSFNAIGTGVTFNNQASSFDYHPLINGNVFNTLTVAACVWGTNAHGICDPGTNQAFNTLPTADAKTQGRVAFVNNSNTNVWGAVAAGGGANFVGVFNDGASWTVYSK